MTRAAFTTLGCKVNQYETQKILESFEARGFEIVPFDAEADVYVVNSCSVTSIAESKSRYTIRRANRLNPAAKVVVTGCASQMARNRGEAMEGADLLVPNPDKLHTLEHLAQHFPDLLPPKPSQAQPSPRNGRTRATLKVQDGCSVMCSYCSIPYTRPGMTSRPAHEVLEEARRLEAQGYREIVLTGVLIGAYGPASGSGGPDFEDLVEMLASACGPSVRLRISSIEMRQVTPRLLDLVRQGTVVPHLHIPLQSGDDDVLSDMNRPYRREDFAALIDRCHRAHRDMSVTTDIMVGFPTETEACFENTLDLARRCRFLKVHVFRFSPRFGTPADAWGDPVTPPAKLDRAERLRALSDEMARWHLQRSVGRTARVLIESKATRDGLLEGLTDNYLTVAFSGPHSLMRTMADVRIDGWRDGRAYGELVSRPNRDLRLA